jgi:hypothetical protein
MKLIFLIILLCGITSTPVHTAHNAKAKKSSVDTRTTTTKASVATIDMLPSGLLFQF